MIRSLFLRYVTVKNLKIFLPPCSLVYESYDSSGANTYNLSSISTALTCSDMIREKPKTFYLSICYKFDLSDICGVGVGWVVSLDSYRVGAGRSAIRV